MDNKEIELLKIENAELKSLLRIVASSSDCKEAIKKGDYALKVARLLNDVAEVDSVDTETMEKFTKQLKTRAGMKIDAEKTQKDLSTANSYNGNYSKLKVGDKFAFGQYGGKTLNWIVLKKESDSLIALCDSIIKKSRWDLVTSVWENSEIRTFLNDVFYKQCFTSSERNRIKTYNGDKFFLLDEEECKEWLRPGFITSLDYWWLRSTESRVFTPHSIYGSITTREASADYASDHFVGSAAVNNPYGVRPALNIKF